MPNEWKKLAPTVKSELRNNSIDLLRRMIQELRISQRVTGLLLGYTRVTVTNYVTSRVMPTPRAEWIDQIQEIHIQPGRAVIVLGMPADTPTGSFRRFPDSNVKNRSAKKSAGAV